MDMNTAFDLEVQEHYPNARIVFHVVANTTWFDRK